MTSLSMRTHPDVLFGFSNHHVELILRVENENDHPIWAEAEIAVPENISLSPNNSLRKGRVRIGIIGKNEFLEKAVRVYSGSLTSPQMYKCSAILFVFNKDGVIDKRMERSFNLRCELKKEATL
ncbi:MAG: hypothetical protein PHF60_03945 [Candidatus ainarchaeum sp.]|nr:hypothetical protein [Candidatus ainarchaeum sp.]